MADHHSESQNPEILSRPSSPLQVTELLYKILWYLPMQDLLTCHNVCENWQGLIRQDDQLRRRLWLAEMGWMEADGGFRREDGVWVKYLGRIGFVEASLDIRRGYGGGSVRGLGGVSG